MFLFQSITVYIAMYIYTCCLAGLPFAVLKQADTFSPSQDEDTGAERADSTLVIL